MIEEIKNIPQLPQVSLELIRHAFQDEPDIQLVASIVERDPVFTAKLFKTVNSASFGLKVEVKNVSQAISLLGLDTLRATIVSIGLGEYFVTGSLGNSLDARMLCTHSLATAVIMKEVGRRIGAEKTDQLYLIGLLHDLGIIALDTLPDYDYGEVLRLLKSGEHHLEAERKVFGMDNLQVWQVIANTWGFPAEIIEMHEGSVQGIVDVPTIKIINSASRMAGTLGYYFVDDLQEDPSRRWEFASTIDKKAMQEICQSVQTQVGVLGDILNLPAPDPAVIQQTLVTVSHQLSQANFRYEKIRKDLAFQVEVMEALNKVVTGIIRSLDTDSLACVVLENIMSGFQMDGSLLIHQDSKGGFGGYVATITDQGGAEFKQVQLAFDQLSPYVKKCMECASPIKVQPVKDPFLMKHLSHASLAWVTPIFVRGKFSSILGIGVREERCAKYNNEDFGKAVQILAGEVGLSLDNTRLFRRMRLEARTDGLTSIFNRRTIMKILAAEFARVKRKPGPLTVAIFDIDNFKAINDNRGHLAGDNFLKQIAQLFKNEVRQSDYIGRYGGDEFVAILPDTTPQEAQVVVDRIRKRLSNYCHGFEGPDIGKKLSVSCGVAGIDDGMSRADELINLADEALYEAKKAGRDSCKVYARTPA